MADFGKKRHLAQAKSCSEDHPVFHHRYTPYVTLGSYQNRKFSQHPLTTHFHAQGICVRFESVGQLSMPADVAQRLREVMSFHFLLQTCRYYECRTTSVPQVPSIDIFFLQTSQRCWILFQMQGRNTSNRTGHRKSCHYPQALSIFGLSTPKCLWLKFISKDTPAHW